MSEQEMKENQIISARDNEKIEIKEDQQNTDQKDAKELDPKMVLTNQILNVILFIICMALNASASLIAPKSLSEISDEVDVKIQPAGYAFSIWGIIYTLLAIFVFYQALPKKWAKDRNEDLIFNKISRIFQVNMVINGVWLAIFQQANTYAYFFGAIDISFILITNIMIMRLALRNKVNWIEWIGLRAGFSIYSGWVTAATILNISIYLRTVGLKDPDMAISEESASIFIVWTAFGIYNAVVFNEKNPLYGLVLCWVSLAIYVKQDKLNNLRNNLLAIMIINLTIVVFYSIYLIWKRKEHKLGLFY